MAFLATLFFSKVDVYTCEGEQDWAMHLRHRNWCRVCNLKDMKDM